MAPSLSLILPFRNAETTLRQDVERLLDVLPDLAARFELLLVDDASTDLTPEIAQDLAREYPQIRLLRNDQPLGREGAVAAARRRARGESVIVPSGARAEVPAAALGAPLPAGKPASFVAHLRELVG